MDKQLEIAKKILNDLESQITNQKKFWFGFLGDNPDFEQLPDNNWRAISSHCWLHGATEIIEKNALESWLFDRPPLSETAKMKASEAINAWSKWLEIKDAYYKTLKQELEKPLKNETLRDYLNRVALLIANQGKGETMQWRALKSFLSYLRNLFYQEIAFIEQIIPEKMDVGHGHISRKIPLEAYPIPQETAADIIYTFANLFREGRADAQHGFAEALGLCWLCVTASRLRLPTEVEMIYRIKATSLNRRGKFPTLLEPTYFGDRKVRISRRFANFFHAISKIPSDKPRDTILQKPFRSLTRTLDRALHNLKSNPKLGNITYLTFLSTPHIFGEAHRPHH